MISVKKVSTRDSDIIGTLRASYYKTGSRNLIENIKIQEVTRGLQNWIMWVI
jgi:hypothetical protein